MAEARNLRNMTNMQTPLLGQENTPLHTASSGTGFESATPRHGAAPTPNPLPTPARGGVLSTPRTVGIGATPLRTPMRDDLSINDAASAYGETPQNDKRKLQAARRALQAGFLALPKPENNFELAEDEDEEAEAEVAVMTEEDAAEHDARMKAARELEERLELARRSSVVKLNLPRPANIDLHRLLHELESDEDDATVRLINEEMASLMKHDSLAHPLPGTTAPGGTPSDYDMPDDDFVTHARALVHTELAGALGLPGATDDQLRIAISNSIDDEETAFSHTWATERQGLVYLPSARSWVDASTLSPAKLHESYSAMITASSDRMIAEATKASKAEKKLAKQLGGYQAINAQHRKGLVETIEDVHTTHRELETFLMLKSMEEAGAPGRLEKKREEVVTLEKRERDLQARYAELNDERRERLAAIEQVSLMLRFQDSGRLADHTISWTRKWWCYPHRLRWKLKRPTGRFR